MKQIGLTGNIGSGKTTVCHIFETFGVPIYYADEKAKMFLETKDCVEQIKNMFGVEYIGEDGFPDRKKIAGLVFNDQAKLKQLEMIIHPQVQNDYVQWAARQKDSDYVIMEAAILFETEQAKNFDQVILVTAPEELRIERVCKRDCASRKQVLKRIRNQWEEHVKISYADYVIVNDEQAMLIPQVKAVHQAILNHENETNIDNRTK